MPLRRYLLPGLTLTCAALAAACLPWSVATGSAVARVDRELKQAYGISLTASGGTELTLLPWPRLTFRSVALANEDRPLATSNLLTVHLGLLPLLAGEAQVTELAFDGASINLAERPDDDRWALALRRLGRQAVDSAAPAHLTRLALRRSTVTWIDPRSGQPDKAQDVTLAASWPSLRAGLEVVGSLAWRGRAATFSLEGLRPTEALTGATTPFSARLAWPQGSLSLSGTGTFAGGPQLDGRGRLETSALGETLAWLGADMALAPLVGPLTVDASFRSGETGVLLPALRVSAGANRLDGAGAVTDIGRRMSITATLASDALDLAPVVGPLRQALSAQAGWSRDPLSLDGFTGCDLDLRLSAGTATAGGLRFEDVAAGLQVKAGGIEATIGRAGLQGGTLKGRLALASAAGGAELRATGSFDRVDLGGVLADLGLGRWVQGDAQGNLAIEGTGGTVEELVRRVGGRAAVSMRDGEIAGVNLGEMALRTEASRSAVVKPSGKTPFERAEVAATLVDGNASVTEASLRAAALQARLNGRLSLPERTLSARAELEVEGGRPGILFDVSGPWDRVTARPAGLAAPPSTRLQLPVVTRPGLPPRASAYAQ